MRLECLSLLTAKGFEGDTLGYGHLCFCSGSLCVNNSNDSYIMLRDKI